MAKQNEAPEVGVQDLDIHLVVSVTMRGGLAVTAQLEAGGGPWGYSDQPAVWNPETEEWTEASAEDSSAAEDFITDLLSAGKPRCHNCGSQNLHAVDKMCADCGAEIEQPAAAGRPRVLTENQELGARMHARNAGLLAELDAERDAHDATLRQRGELLSALDLAIVAVDEATRLGGPSFVAYALTADKLRHARSRGGAA